MPTCCVHPLPYHADPRERFALVRAAPGACLLDGGRPGANRGRFDLFSAWPEQRLSPGPGEDGRAFFARCRAALASLGRAEAPDGCELPFTGGLLGYLGYDFGRRLERLPAQAADDLQLPDAAFGLHAWALVSDHQRQTSQLVFHPSLPAQRRGELIALFEAPATPATPGEFRLLAPFAADLEASQYKAAIDKIQAYIRAGDCYQVNFAQRFQASWQGDPWTAYCALRDACPTPFAGYLTLDDGAILSLSPERFLSVRQGHV
ncbi:MAG TPA: chorismate-binding protein, partial [Pseudomonas sp.]